MKTTATRAANGIHARISAVVATTVLGFSLALPAAAQSAPAPQAPDQPTAKAECRGSGFRHHKHHGGKRHMDDAQRAQHHARRMEHLKTLLQLQPGQQAAWDSFVAAHQPKARPAMQRPAAQELTTPQRIEQRQQMRQQYMAAAQAREQATLAFYKALNPAQQKAFDALRSAHRSSKPWGKGHGKGAHRH